MRTGKKLLMIVAVATIVMVPCVSSATNLSYDELLLVFGPDVLHGVWSEGGAVESAAPGTVQMYSDISRMVVVPEPATMVLVGLSLLGLAARKRWMA